MSSNEDDGLNIDLDSLFQPAWAKESGEKSRYAHYTGKEEVSRDRRDRRGGRRDDRRGKGRGAGSGGPGAGGRGPRPQGGGGGGRGPRRDDRGGQGDRRGGGPRRDDNRGRGPRGDRRGGLRRDPRERREELPEIDTAIVPGGKIVDSLAKQIRLTGMAYPLFEIAGLVVGKPERFDVRYSIVRKADGTPVCPLFLCDLDDTLFPSEEDAVGHVLRRHFDTFYQTEKIPKDPPKGNYTFVAQCGLSGKILGPPNLHGYQEELRKLHSRRYARMPFDAYKAKVKIVRDEEVVQKWIEEQSFATEYTALNVPEEIKLDSRDAVEKHFRETHKEAIVKSVRSHVISSKHASEQPNRAIKELYRRTLTQQTKFPIKVVHELSQQFSSRGLQFFKVDKTVTHVAVSRPRHLDLESTPVNEGVKKVIEFIDATPECNRRKLMEGLAPKPVETAGEPAAKAETGAEGELSEAASSEAAESQQPAAHGKLHLTSEEQRIHDDLHWLIHEGHVIEFANGVLESAKAPKNQQAKDAAAAYEARRKKHKPKKPAAEAKPAPSLDEAVNTEASGESAKPNEPQPASAEDSAPTAEVKEQAPASGEVESVQVDEPAEQKTETVGGSSNADDAPDSVESESEAVDSAAGAESLSEPAPAAEETPATEAAEPVAEESETEESKPE